jgi:CheY-like chemotaxis protein
MKIMIIDDIMMNVLVLKHAVKSFGQVAGFQDVGAGLRALREAYETEDPFDLLFLDILMPGTDGLTVLRQVQEIGASHASHARTKVVMVTSQNERQSFREAIQLGAAGYLLKPILPERVREEVRRLTEGSTGQGKDADVTGWSMKIVDGGTGEEAA